jgi:copper chaperone CopZ
MIRVGWINSLLSAFLVSLCCPCCLLQIFLNLFGIGCAGLNTLLLPYRPLFISLTVISLTYSFLRYRPSKWHFTAIVTVTLFLSFSPEILRTYNNQLTINDKLDDNVIITHWQIVGMHCESCRLAATRSLQKIDGILSANVDLDSGQADLITHIVIDDDIITQALQSVGFQGYKII